MQLNKTTWWPFHSSKIKNVVCFTSSANNNKSWKEKAEEVVSHPINHFQVHNTTQIRRQHKTRTNTNTKTKMITNTNTTQHNTKTNTTNTKTNTKTNARTNTKTNTNTSHHKDKYKDEDKHNTKKIIALKRKKESSSVLTEKHILKAFSADESKVGRLSTYMYKWLVQSWSNLFWESGDLLSESYLCFLLYGWSIVFILDYVNL